MNYYLCLQYLLGRPVRFHDLAFFDPVIYESLRQLVLDSERQGADNAFALQVLPEMKITKNKNP
jgi:E3 ubiquitin-protein ligase EDD1